MITNINDMYRITERIHKNFTNIYFNIKIASHQRSVWTFG